MSNLQHIPEYPSGQLFPAIGLPEPHWYAVHIRVRHEKRVAARLREKGVTTFLPLVTQMHQWSDRRQQLQTPLFSCYAFVRLALSVEWRLSVLTIPGVLGLVGVAAKAIPIPDKQIEDIRSVLAHNTPCSPYPFLREGQRVRIRGGALDAVEGILVAQAPDLLVISIELLQRAVSLRIEGYDLEPV
jgi:transcription antitermination factor NusG